MFYELSKCDSNNTFMDELDHSIVFKKKSGNLILYGSLKSNEEEVKRVQDVPF